MKRKRVATLVSVLLGIALALGALEAASRLRLLPCAPKGPNVWEPDPELGWFHRAGTSGWGQGCIKGGIDWRSFVEINDQGLRDDRSHPYDKPDGEFRVLLLGDSFTEGFTVDLADHFAPALERRLTAIAGRPVEVLNAGVSAWGNAQELVYYMLEGARYSPDLVVLLFNPANDIGENIPGLGGTDRQQAIKPWFTFDGDKLVLRDFPATNAAPMPGAGNGPIADWLERRTHVYPLLHHLFTEAAQELGASADRDRDVGIANQPEREPSLAPSPEATGDAASRGPATSRPAAKAVRRPQPPPRLAFALETLPPAWEYAWWITKAVLLLTRREVESRGARFAVAVVPSRFGTIGFRETWFDGSDRLAVDHTLPGARAEGLLAAERFKTCLLQPAFRDHFERTGRHGFHQWDVHWSAEGHALVATELARCLQDLGLVPVSHRE